MNVEQTPAALVSPDSRPPRTNVDLINHVAPPVERLGLCACLLPDRDGQGVKKLQVVAVS